MELLQFLKIEIESAKQPGGEENLTHNSKHIRTEYGDNQNISRNRQNKIQGRTSTCEFMTPLENLVLPDSPNCQEPITIPIGADYYYDVVTGKIKHLSKKLVAVETIFGWCLQGRNSENQSSLALSVIVQENLISDQLKKFWDLEVSDLIDSENEFDVSENQIMKNFESNIKYDEKAKLETRELKDIGKLLRRDLHGSESDSRKILICSLNIERYYRII
ncbi:integrase catalytic domain-containing protein [Trichonephila inaurata madagascariensis]|uniref:Integrase catalytic domain-containing protein n=1 Tax=Trichonephila inaurata madagascariensis TaxID=2747483 RepID=A0A8X6WZ49_9ARAC|nr:integrase catalytic domain-containing protein [Trichonephila inaurata madagascariensis]